MVILRCVCAAAMLALATTTFAADDELLWRQVDPDNLVFVELTEGRVVVELNPMFAPATVKQFRKLVRDKFYEGLAFYRVIDGFVAQGGDGSDLGQMSAVPLIDAEFEREWSEDLPYVPVQENDLFAPETGFIEGFAVGRDPKSGSVWLTHCPGVVAMARNEAADSSRTDFYIVIGQAPRYLDRNMNVFGRVIDGMEVVQRIARGDAGNNGLFSDETATTRIRHMMLASDISEEERPAAYVPDTDSKGFAALLEGRRNRTQAFFHHKPPEVLDVCQVPMAGRMTK
jgi:peptidylprolyl isomerase